ncbi:MAG: ABC transporter permease [bacterium]
MPSLIARLRAALFRLLGLARRHSLDDRMREEMTFHVDMLAERNAGGRQPSDDARRAALIAFGARQQHSEDARDAWRSRVVEESARDVRFALRALRRAPTFTAAVVLSLGIGIGATSTIYTITERVVLRPLPYGGGGPLALVTGIVRNDPGAIKSASFPDYADWVTGNPLVESSAAFSVWGATLSGTGAPEQLGGSRVSANFFRTLGVAPRLGRGFRADDDVPGAPPVVVIAHSLWTRRFNSDPQLIGQTIKLSGTMHTVIGVLPDDFRDPEPFYHQHAELWKPLNIPPTAARGSRFLRALIRFRPGVTIDRAQRNLDVIAHRLADEFPASNRNRGVRVTSLQEQVVGASRPILFAVLGAAACLLLIVCGNVASLVLARHTVRSPEIALRTAMGAARERVARLLFAESAVLALGGGVVAIGIAVAATAALRRLAPADLPRAQEIVVDPQVVAVTMAITVLTAVIFGLVPAVRASRADLATMLRDGGRRSTSSGTSRSAIVVVELALSLVLLASAGLLTKSLVRLTAVPTGLDPTHLLSFRVSVPGARYQTDSSRRAFFRVLEQRVSSATGLADVATVSAVPFTQINDIMLSIAGDERNPSPTGERFMARSASPGYFKVMRIPILAGREFTIADTARGQAVAILTHAGAIRAFGTDNPIGRRLIINPGDSTRITVVGVVADVRFKGPREESDPELYQPEEQQPWSSNAIVLRTAGDPMAMLARVRTATQSLDADIAVADVKPMSELLGAYMARQRFYASVFGLFAVTALLLSAIGIYGVIAYVVAQRRKEIAVRIALGAQTSDILRKFVLQAVTLTGIGLAIGVAGSLSVARVLGSLLFQVAPSDVTTMVGAGVILSAIGVAASIVPAIAATRISPASALRSE